MKILVCVKQVPDMESDFRVNADGTGYDEEGLVWRMNRYDEYALEEAVQIKERYGDVEITALTVGPSRAEAVVRRALECGADHGVHILTPDRVRLDARETAFCIAFYTRHHKFHLSLFGVMSEDYQRYQTGPLYSSYMRLPYATTVVMEKISDDNTRIDIERELEGGRKELLNFPLPAVLTIQTGINEPRYPTLTNKLRAKKQSLEIVNFHEIPLPSRTAIAGKVYTPASMEKADYIEGSIEEQAKKIVEIIHAKSKLL